MLAGKSFRRELIREAVAIMNRSRDAFSKLNTDLNTDVRIARFILRICQKSKFPLNRLQKYWQMKAEP